MIDGITALAGLPSGLRNSLLKTYREIATNYAERRWEPAELNGGKFSEVVYSIINGALLKDFPSKATKPSDMVAACRTLERMSPDPSLSGEHSFRILIPRVLVALYDIRNNRGVGHVGGDVDPNYIDGTVVYGMSSWVMAELVRIFHKVSIDEARDVVEALIERHSPLVWEIGEVKRVLDTKLETKDQVLLLLHQEAGWVAEKDLCGWVEYSTLSMFRKRVLVPLHKARLLEFNSQDGRVHISTLGSERAMELVKNRLAI